MDFHVNLNLEPLVRRSRGYIPELTVISHEVDATTLPSGKKATEVSYDEWTSSVWSIPPVAASQSLPLLS